MRHCYACAAEGWRGDEVGERCDGRRFVDGAGVWEVVVLECCLVDYGGFAEGDVGAEDVEVLGGWL